jgi:sigma-B regulation protein RsbU (phosphoserine phosphatase)
MATSSALDAKPLYRRLDSLFSALDPKKPQGQLLESFLEQFFEMLREPLRLRAACIYAERRDDFALLKEIGEFGMTLPDVLDRESPPFQLVYRHRVYVFSDPGAEGSPSQLGILPHAPSAAIIVGKRPGRHVFFFVLADGWSMEELDFTLNTVRAALGSRLVEERVRGSFQQAAEIQQSLLMEEAPDFQGYEIACRSIPAEEVGGDFFDFHPMNGDILGLAIGDASGHGLPAALLVRDVVTGLRMGLEKEFKLAYVFGKLNRVIHRSTLSSRFVSVFYGELELSGSLIYINAGHQPPLLFGPSGVEELQTGGTVIGPLPEARFRRGFARLDPGSVLVLCTDGILERRNRKGEFFGEERLKQVVEKNRGASADTILEALFAAALAFGKARPWEDDATAVIVRRLPGAPSQPAENDV